MRKIANLTVKGAAFYVDTQAIGTRIWLFSSDFPSADALNLDVKLLIIVLAMLMLSMGAVQSWNAKSRYVEAALLSEAFTLVSPVKKQVSNYFFATGRLPLDNQEANIARAESLFGSSVQGISVHPGGIIRADFSETGDSRALVFVPQINSETGYLSWRCMGESIAKKVVTALKPACDYSSESQQRKLLSAVRSNNAERLQKLLDSRVGDEADINRQTLLSTAIRYSHIDVAKTLIRAGASIDEYVPNLNGEQLTPLMIAWRTGSADSVRLLLDQGADVSIEDQQSRTAIDYAESAKHRFTAEQYSALWTRQQSRLNLPPAQQTSPLLVTQNYSELPAYRYVSQLRDQCQRRGKAVPHWVAELSDVAGQTPESESSRWSKNCRELILLLISLRESQPEWFDESVSLLIQELPDSLVREIAPSVLTVGSKQEEPGLVRHYLSYAIAHNKPKLARYLLDAGANVNSPTNNNSHPIIEASKQGQAELVEYLIANGADLSVRDVFGRTAFLAAIARGHSRVAAQLSEAGSNLSVKDVNGMDATMLAAP